MKLAYKFMVYQAQAVNHSKTKSQQMRIIYTELTANGTEQRKTIYAKSMYVKCNNL